jgi:hypothetical protein
MLREDNRMTNGSKIDDSQALPNTTIVAIFAIEQDARQTVKDLRKAGFAQTWIGITKKQDAAAGEPVVEDANPLVRFFSADRLPLHKALLLHGVAEKQAQSIEAQIVAGCSVVTVYGEDNPSRASELLQSANGLVVDVDGATHQASTDGDGGWSFARDEHALGMAAGNTADDALYEEFFEVRRV